MRTFDVNSKKDIQELFLDCKKALDTSYSPYSQNRVGACIISATGAKYYGSNIENASYGLTMCAERTAMFNARISNVKKEDQLVIGIAADFNSYAWLCGACRQVMVELLPLECHIVIFNKEGEYKIWQVKDCMPGIFSSSDLKEKN